MRYSLFFIYEETEIRMSIHTTMEERIEIMKRSEKGESAWRIARDLGCMPETVRKWYRRGQQQGRTGLASHMGRPKLGALSSFSMEIRDTLIRWRTAHPSWGAKTLYAELKRQPCFVTQKLPSIASISRFLQEHEFPKPREKHSELPDSNREETSMPHMVWEMDAKGYQYVPDVGMITLVNLNDRFSHARLLSYPCHLGKKRVIRHINTADYQVVLRLAFTHWGLPSCVQVDHESVFYENTTKSPFPTILHLWLRALGIRFIFSRVRRPTDQAMTERSHQIWSGQVLDGQCFASWQELYDSLQNRRDFLNYHLPCATLNQPPLCACPQAKHSGRIYRPEYETDIIDLQYVYEYLAKGKWFRRISPNGTFSLGGNAYYIGTKWIRQQFEIRFDAVEQKFLCYDEPGNLIKQIAWKGDLQQRLIGNTPPCLKLPSFQLHLPFTWDDVRMQHFLCEIEATSL